MLYNIGRSGVSTVVYIFYYFILFFTPLFGIVYTHASHHRTVCVDSSVQCWVVKRVCRAEMSLARGKARRRREAVFVGG